jgi:hypothetical protein
MLCKTELLTLDSMSRWLFGFDGHPCFYPVCFKKVALCTDVRRLYVQYADITSTFKVMFRMKAAAIARGINERNDTRQ